MHACRVLTISTRLAVQEPRSGPCSSTLGTPGCRGRLDAGGHNSGGLLRPHHRAMFLPPLSPIY